MIIMVSEISQMPKSNMSFRMRKLEQDMKIEAMVYEGDGD